MDTVEVKVFRLLDGRVGLKYPPTAPLWDMRGYYVSGLHREDGVPIKLNDLETVLLVP
jgi:hypothetical protein